MKLNEGIKPIQHFLDEIEVLKKHIVLLEAANAEQRKKAESYEVKEKESQQVRVDLERRVEQRTLELLETNSKLKEIVEEHQHIEEALNHEKVLLDALMDTIPDSIYFKDRQCRLLRVNRKEMQDLKIDDMNQIIGKTDSDLFGEEFGQKTLADDQQLMESGESIIGLIESRQLENNQINWTLTTKVPLRDPDGHIVGLVGITREINALMKAQTERDKVISELQEALAVIKTLSGLVPICASCKKIRDDKGYWTQVEAYIQERSQARFSHGICPDCMSKLYPDFKPKATAGH
jgi:transcriptional regulator with PAS, ATPase and Fis domain